MPKKKTSSKTTKKTTTTNSVVSKTVAPVASEAPVAKVESVSVPTLGEDFTALLAQLTSLRSQLTSITSQVRQLSKRSERELRLAEKNTVTICQNVYFKFYDILLTSKSSQNCVFCKQFDVPATPTLVRIWMLHFPMDQIVVLIYVSFRAES